MAERLINAIRLKEVLYNTQLPQYRDMALRNAAWNVLAKELNMPADECKDTWWKLRSSYTNAMKRRDRALLKNKKLHPWRYEAEMRFLKPFLERYKDDATLDAMGPQYFDVDELLPSSSRGKQNTEYLVNNPNNITLFYNDSEDDEDEPVHYVTDDAYNKEPTEHEQIIEGFNETILDKLENISERTKPKVDDEFDSFAKYIANTLRTLTAENAIQAKLELQTALTQIQLQDVREKSNK